MAKTALITGITGQDGAYLAEFLLNKGYRVYGTYRRLSTPNFWRLQSLKIFEQVNLIPADLLDSASILRALKISNPDEIYHLAAQSFVGASFEQPVGTGQITGLGVTRLLEIIKENNPKIKFYQASTSELYGNGTMHAQNENTNFEPASPYSAAKLYGYWMTKIYREAYGIFACNGILFNHESPLRGLEFITRKVTNSVAKIALGLESELRLGNLDAKRDWGYAREYVESMWLMLQQESPDDYVVASNETHSVRELVSYAFSLVNLDWQKFVKVDQNFIRPLDVKYLQGDNRKAETVLGWKPRTTFHELIKIMVDHDVDRWSRYQKGERFPWDAPFYPNENTIISRDYKLDQ
ncbi:TPA: GDP-mannose 4,6-dehydratase [Candidatus Falkowbacteria bacterium]|nr:GDP-mannose 4,6-dehydratase [Candidatus Falkowbacteria bacterium]